MNNDLKELKKIFPSSKEIIIADKKIFVKPMVWTDFFTVIDDFGKVIEEVSKKGLDFSSFDEKKDLRKLIPVMTEILNIFAKWLSVDLQWLKDNLTLKGTVELLFNFIEINEWLEVKSLFLGLKLKVAGEEKK